MNDFPDLVSQEVGGVILNSLRIACLLFADDLVLLADSPEHLQNSIDLLSAYCNTYELTVNVNKTKILVFGRKSISPAQIWRYRDHNIEVVDKYKYLGVLFTPNGSFKECANALANKGRNVLFQLMRNIGIFLVLK